MDVKDITIGMVGSGGDGVVSAGEFLVSAAAAEGLYAYLLKASARRSAAASRAAACGSAITAHSDRAVRTGALPAVKKQHWLSEVSLASVHASARRTS